MKQCAIKKEVRGQRAVDGAGVRLVRVLGNRDVREFDPFLMLDSFDSKDPSDYLAGFPMHPHRGIETITYLMEGTIEHEDSLGNRGVIHGGEAQWMTAGRGILHQEMPKAAKRMLGFQLWLNLPKKQKMTEPTYLSVTAEQMGLVEEDGATVRVLSGAYQGVRGVTPRHIPATILDLALEAGKILAVPVRPEDTAFLFTIEGALTVGGQKIQSKTAVLFESGEEVLIKAPEDTSARVIFYAARPLREPVAWGGPIVMNTEEELQEAFWQLRTGTFIQ